MENSMTDTTNNPTIPTTSELPMPTTMPYHWEMFQLIRQNTYAGFRFFSPANMRFSKSRIQSVPPYKGRVFVTSEKPWGSRGYYERVYSVRCIKPCGRIATLDRFDTRYHAHTFAKAYAAENFARVGNESIQLPPETKMV